MYTHTHTNNNKRGAEKMYIPTTSCKSLDNAYIIESIFTLLFVKINVEHCSQCSCVVPNVRRVCAINWGMHGQTHFPSGSIFQLYIQETLDHHTISLHVQKLCKLEWTGFHGRTMQAVQCWWKPSQTRWLTSDIGTCNTVHYYNPMYFTVSSIIYSNEVGL